MKRSLKALHSPATHGGGRATAGLGLGPARRRGGAGPGGEPRYRTEVIQREGALVRRPRFEALGAEVHSGRHGCSAGPRRSRESAVRVERDT